MAVLHDRSERCRDCGEYFADWVNEKGHRLEGNKAPKKAIHLVQPCGCEAVEMAAQNEDPKERRPGQKTVLVAASPNVPAPHTP